MSVLGVQEVLCGLDTQGCRDLTSDLSSCFESWGLGSERRLDSHRLQGLDCLAHSCTSRSS